MEIKSGVVIFLLTCCGFVRGDLYNNTDPMVLLNVTNFYDTVLGTPNAWIIEFYSSWCGHCIKFAPTWRLFSHEVVDWAHTIKVAVLDCSDSYNVPICRDYEVLGYPTIRLFGAFNQKGDLGVISESRGVMDLQVDVIKFLVALEAANNHTDSWVNLLPYDEPLGNIFKSASDQVTHAAIIVEDEASIMGSQVILDLGSYPVAYVRRISGESLYLDSVDLPALPALIIVNREDESTEVPREPLSTREEFTAFIIHHLNLRNRVIEATSPEPTTPGVRRPPATRLPVKTSDKMYLVDLENTLSYALRIEVASKKVVEGEALEALRNFTEVLVNYLPTRVPVFRFLINLNGYLSEVTSLQGSEFEKDIEILQSSESFLPQQLPWKRCLGSTENYRGYPCGLWTLFHALTVNAAITREHDPGYDPMETLRAIHGYVKHFFGCLRCSKHFQAMYVEDAETFVQKQNDEVEWLWRGHNKVNKRLKGDLSEDPVHPKRQYPTRQMCPKCWKEYDAFNTEEVLKYLKKVYGKSYVSTSGTNVSPYNDLYGRHVTVINAASCYSLSELKYISIFISFFYVFLT